MGDTGMKKWLMIAAAGLATATLGRDMVIYNGRMTSPLNAGGFAITNVAAPTQGSDLATKAYVDAVDARVAAKQDKLPYATNAIPSGVIADAPWLTTLAPAIEYAEAVSNRMESVKRGVDDFDVKSNVIVRAGWSRDNLPKDELDGGGDVITFEESPTWNGDSWAWFTVGNVEEPPRSYDVETATNLTFTWYARSSRVFTSFYRERGSTNVVVYDRIATTNYVGGMRGGGVTTNDVCAIVTNDVAATDWVTNITATSGGKVVTLLNVKWGYGDNPDEWMMKLNVPGIGEAWRPCESPNNTDPNATTLAASEYHELVTTRTFGHNALGLAYERDIARDVTNTVTKSYVENLGIESGIDTNGVNALIGSYDATNLTARLDGKRGIYDNTCQKTTYGNEWKVSSITPGWSYVSGPTWVEDDGWWIAYISNGVFQEDVYSMSSHLANHIVCISIGEESVTFDRYAIATSNKTFVTEDYVANFAKTNDVHSRSEAIATFADKESVSSVSNTVTQWESYWTGNKVRFSVTNYYGNTSGEPPRLRIEESQTNTQGVVTNWVQVWDEVTRETNYYNQADARINAVSSSVMVAAYNQTYTQLANKAPRAWGDVTSSGTKAPAGTVWHTAPSTVFAGGTEYQHITGEEGNLYVLADKGSPVYTSGDEGSFRFSDGDGTSYFGFDIRDSYWIPCRTDGISVTTVGGNFMIHLTYDLTGDNPDIMYSPTPISISNTAWTVVENVSWEDITGGKICEFNASTNKCGFYHARYSYEASNKFLTNMAADFMAGILATNETGVGTSTQVAIYPVATPTGVVWRVQQ